ncbi:MULTISPECIES: FkbM family methyltransferase [Sphingopyxis]|uniref:FkbM family methyltransferase n=1 Tax=Sphingopyxis TaxID=165697 RepID=UPI001644E7CF|nr:MULTISPECIES: FkbM family methyltransferase [Sphingopyxis]QXF11814.1 FkbM family methyltransferase [Sphingopyxis terrae subsp. terrae]
MHKLAKQHHDNGFPQMAVFSHDHIGHVINVDGRYEDDYLQTVFGWLTSFAGGMKDRLALDIGANIGNHAVFLSQHFREVHAFEPNPRTFELLRFNAAHAGNVIAHPRGLSDADVVGTLKENPTNMGGTYIELGANEDVPGKPPVSLGTLDKFVETQGLDDIALIKIDTEGFEARILRGARQVLENHKPLIIFELSPSDFDESGASDVVNILQGHGYHFVAVEKNFQLGKSRIGRYAGFLMRTLFGENYVLRPIEHFESRFYQMIVAVHGDIPVK